MPHPYVANGSQRRYIPFLVKLGGSPRATNELRGSENAIGWRPAELINPHHLEGLIAFPKKYAARFNPLPKLPCTATDVILHLQPCGPRNTDLKSAGRIIAA